MTAGDNQKSYLRYWGKAAGAAGNGAAPYHLLACHALDVAACAQALLRLPQFGLGRLAAALELPQDDVERVAVFFMALHDVGKFARSFQALAALDDAALVACDEAAPYDVRHDTLGWWLWRLRLSRLPELGRWLPLSMSAEVCAVWMRTVCGHHGMPPLETKVGGTLPANLRPAFKGEDVAAADEFVRDVAALLLAPCAEERPACPSNAGNSKADPKDAAAVLAAHSWQLAGLAVLADWLGSNTAHFPYCSHVDSLDAYWARAQQQAARAIDEAGLGTAPLHVWDAPLAVFEHLQQPTPLQRWAAQVALDDSGPQLFILEDVTGAGKTEAALTLAYRLMLAGAGRGLYFALPSMATANQMFARVGQVWRRWFEADARPSLVLTHGARELVEEFTRGIASHANHDPSGDDHYSGDEASVSAQCSAWLADDRKKALLADIGVGTLDQALLAIMPVRHQSLRLLGLQSKVLVVDEVHACDAYMNRILQTLLAAHAAAGGCAVLLSATLPLAQRDELLTAWQQGRLMWLRGPSKPFEADNSKSRFGARSGTAAPAPTPAPMAQPQPSAQPYGLPLPDQRYPLAIHAGRALHVHACPTRAQVCRSVTVAFFHDEGAVLTWLLAVAQAGRCVAWVRNTVADARRAYQNVAAAAVQAGLDAERVTLFHSRYATGQRLEIEADVLARFGKNARASDRAGRILIGTQVLEQSLDFDVDEMVSDLAPMDRLIQRAGRLHRHTRSPAGDPLPDAQPARDGRPAAVLHILSPALDDAPDAQWYARLLPSAQHIYPDTATLWLTARTLGRAGRIDTPGELGAASSARALIEAVFGADGAAHIPAALQHAASQRIGHDMSAASMGAFNTLQLNEGYSLRSSSRWLDDGQVPTRLGDETATVYLARWDTTRGQLLPLLFNPATQPAPQSTPPSTAPSTPQPSQAPPQTPSHPLPTQRDWAQSSLRIRAGVIGAVNISDTPNDAPIEHATTALRRHHRLLAEPALICPLRPAPDGTLTARATTPSGQTLTLRYDWALGLLWTGADKT